MGVWISLLIWLVLAALLLGGWFYNMGQYREATKAVLAVGGSCLAAMWALARFSPGPWLVGGLAAAALVAALVVLVAPAGRAVPFYGVLAASALASLGTVYTMDKFAALPAAVPYVAGGALFVILYVCATLMYARRGESD